MGTPCGSSTERVVISGGRITGEWSSGQVSPNGASTGHGSAAGLSWTSSGRMTAHSGSGSSSDPTAVPDAGPPPDSRKNAGFSRI
jgi:hypothetical protein